MQTEVIGWGSTPPTVQSTLSGDIDTPQHRRAVGYVNDPADPGGVTKFGIAQKFNKQVQVPEIDYSTARSIGYTNYWNGEKPAQFVGTHPRAAIAIFNFGFLTPGGISKCITDTNASALSDLAAVDALCDAMKMYFLKKVEEQPAKKERYRNGWMNRVETVRAYCKAVLL
jgi:lysozyme family protein